MPGSLPCPPGCPCGHHAKETKERISKTRRGKALSSDHCAAIRQGMIDSNIFHDAVSESNRRRTGQKATPEHRENISRTITDSYDRNPGLRENRSKTSKRY